MSEIIYYDTRTDLLDLIPKNSNVLEIGVFVGDFSKEIMSRCNPKNLYLVDPSIHIIRSKSVSFLLSCENDFFDAIYIDGDHTAQAVYNDLCLSYEKIKNGGIIMGHDYHYQVEYAVGVFCEKFNQKIKYIAKDGCPSFFIEISK